MEETRNMESGSEQEQEEKSVIDLQLIYSTLILNWKWFLLSVVICLGLGFAYVKFSTKIFQSSTKVLVRDDSSKSGGSRSGAAAALSSMNLGFMSSSNGIDNEIEIINSRYMVQQTIFNLKAYTEYKHEGLLKDTLVYRKQEINVEMDSTHLKALNAPLNLSISRNGKGYHVKGKYFKPINAVEFENEPYEIDTDIAKLPANIQTKAGMLTLSQNGSAQLKEGTVLKVMMLSPELAAKEYFKRLTIDLSSKNTTILKIDFNDADKERGVDFLNALISTYNMQANIDKNEITKRTEQFINTRLEKINKELGGRDNQLESYKKDNRLVDISLNAKQAILNSDAFDQSLDNANTQVELLEELAKYMDEPSNKYQPIPINVGLSDGSSTALINQYNGLAMQRKQLLHSASENSPTVTPITSQMEDLIVAIKRAMLQARVNMKIRRNAIARQSNKYEGVIKQTPSQEKTLTEIGRQQAVTNGLYLMLLQKREETSMSLASTADKAKIIEPAAFEKKVSPKGMIVMLIALILGIAIPAGILYVLQMMRYKIEGRDDVEKLTSIPVIGDIVVASESAKAKADIVVQENRNNLMTEIFRTIRTNLQFMMKKDDKVILFTSTTSGEGKTFTASNVAISYALLGKKVIIIGLDIRRPRLAELFEIDDRIHGITNLLAKDSCGWDEVKAQIVPSGINANLDLLMAGPVPPNPGELVMRNSLNDTIESLKEHYDYVIIDSAPVGLVADTLQFGKVADRTVYVCRADYTPKSSFGYINKLMKEDKLPNICIILNGIDLSKKKFAYSYGYGKYGKYGRYGNNNSFGSYGNYSNSHYGVAHDDSIKLK